MTASKLTRLNVNLNAETAQALRSLCESRGITATEAIRQAVSVYSYIEGETTQGRKVQVVDESRKTIHELIFM